MVFVADAFGAWLVGLVADAGRRRLISAVVGTDQERALRQAAMAAVQFTARKLYPDDEERMGQLAMVVSEVFSEPSPRAPLSGATTLLQALQDGIAAQLAVLEDSSLTGVGKSSADLLGFPGGMLAQALTAQLVQEIVARGARGGPLAPLASQLNHDVTHLQGLRIESMLGQLAEEVREALLRRDIEQAPEALGRIRAVGHVFISYVREDSAQVDQLQRTLQAAGIPVWRDTADLWPGEDWREKIRNAITDNALVFLACFSHKSVARSRSYQNEELVLAIEQLRLRPPEHPWLVPVRFDDCEIPDRDIGGGRRLTSIQRADLFGDRYDEGAERLVAAILRILGWESDAKKAEVDHWKQEAPRGGERGSGVDPAEPAGSDIGYLTGRGDAFPDHVQAMGRPGQLHRLVIGTDGNNLVMTAARRNLLILGPSLTEKTAGVLVPAILSYPGPVVSTSTKADVLRATGLIRARLGRVWHYSPDGSETPPGCSELRWSPIPPSAKWSTAIALGKAIADISETGGGTQDASYSRIKAGVVIATLLHAAALGAKPMLWLMRAVNGNKRSLDEASEILGDALSPDSQIAASDLQSILDLDESKQGDIFAITGNGFAAYRLPGVLRSAENPNFDPGAFAAGDPHGYNPFRVRLIQPDSPEVDELAWQFGQKGRFDTVYITISSGQHSLIAPIVAGFLSQIREAAFARHRSDEANDNFARPAVLWALDEIADIAPMKDLPETLSQSGGHGLLVACCLQDLQIARTKWDKDADRFLSLFGNIVVHAGIRDEATLRAISTVIGQAWVDVVTEGITQKAGRRPGRRKTLQQTITSQLVDRLEPGAVAGGRVNEHPHFVLGLEPSGWRWFFCMPYYSAPPWPQMLIANMEYGSRTGDVLEACWGIQPPILDRDHTGQSLAAVGGSQLLERYRKALVELKNLARRRSELLAGLGDDSLLTGYDDSWTGRLPAPVRVFIALKGLDTAENTPGIPDSRPDRATIAGVLETLRGIRQANPGEELILSYDATPLAEIFTPPFKDLVEEPLFKPEWVLELAGHTAGLGIVPGGMAARSKTTPIQQWSDQITGTDVLIEAWCLTRPALYMVRRVAEKLQAITPSCYIAADAFQHFGIWHE